ncbi:MAG: PTS sugar transporter subunit IIA [Solobacterium sp.]|jgi:PTS system ascorbate-specific IIA component|nr:PTS sugar transporter subunit IIA [Solobacterium sp.]MCH4048586.1 PTS sugar transporter subunit IIA [Solobacterium sp.]MCH4074563.1 PTS sugar transporter subunit IIA [Solobacterium sp.]MCI1314547.1 PTS sugar transporter subunit IIA [Solobacterium sp.]MCI1408358.1 PTS sugar transporter subunit IIA [Solobacterium sp.]
MSVDMIQDFIKEKHYAFFDEASDWKDAIRKACQPIIEDGTVEPAYAENIIECVGKYGPYIVILPGVAMPHSTEGGALVHKTCISFMKLAKPVSFDENDPEKWADLFFTIASENAEKHLAEMQQLAGMLSDETLVEKLHKVTNRDELQALGDSYNPE